MHETKLDTPIVLSARSVVALLQMSQAFQQLTIYLPTIGIEVSHFTARIPEGTKHTVEELEPGPHPSEFDACIREAAQAIYRYTGIRTSVGVGDPATGEGVGDIAAKYVPTEEPS